MNGCTDMIDCELIDRTPDIRDYLDFRMAAGWGNLEEDAARIGLSRSLYSVCAYREGKLIGFGRVVGDGGCHFLIVDIIVRSDMQRKGVGTRIMKAIMGYVASRAREGTMISLMAAPGMAQFYERFGFRARSQRRPGMCIVWNGKRPGEEKQKN